MARGIVPFGGATVRAVTSLGWGNAMRFLLTAEEFGAEEAHHIGLAPEIVAAGTQHHRATEIAQQIAARAPLGVQATLRQSRLARDVGVDAAVADMRVSLPGTYARPPFTPRTGRDRRARRLHQPG